MSPKTLHILNGDGTAGGFNESRLKGDTLIWREVLCEGPVGAQPSMEEFWARRKAFLESSYTDTKTGFFETKVLSEILKLKNASDYDEIVLWFEFDLFCQVNLMYLLSWLYANRIYQRVLLSLVCPKDHPEVPNFHGMGQLTPKQLEDMYSQRNILSEKELHAGHKAWNAYQSPDPMNLQRMLERDFGSLDCMAEAIMLHLQRFPNTFNGLNRIETELLKSLEPKPLTTKQLFFNFWAVEPGYGFGDIQILNALKRLEPELVLSNGSFRITSLGKACLNGDNIFHSIKNPGQFIGGHWQSPPFRYKFDKKKMMLVAE